MHLFTHTYSDGYTAPVGLWRLDGDLSASARRRATYCFLHFVRDFGNVHERNDSEVARGLTCAKDDATTGRPSFPDLPCEMSVRSRTENKTSQKQCYFFLRIDFMVDCLRLEKQSCNRDLIVSLNTKHICVYGNVTSSVINSIKRNGER